jgi:hypothetical protein
MSCRAAFVLMLLIAGSLARGDDALPPEFAPFEHLIGAWKGQGIRRAGWQQDDRPGESFV